MAGYRQYEERHPDVDPATLPEVHNFGSSGINARTVMDNFEGAAKLVGLEGDERLVTIISLGANAARIEPGGNRNTLYDMFLRQMDEIIQAAGYLTPDGTTAQVGVLEIPSMDDAHTNGPGGWRGTGFRFPDAEMRRYTNGLEVLCDQLGAVYIGGVRRALALARTYPELSPVSSDKLHPGLGAIPMALLVERFINTATGFDPGPEGTVLGPIHPIFQNPEFCNAVLLG
jgi:hypothetical protein